MHILCIYLYIYMYTNTYIYIFIYIYIFFICVWKTTRVSSDADRVLGREKINYFKRFRIANCRLSFQKTYLATHISVNEIGTVCRLWGTGSGSRCAHVCVCANLKWRMTTRQHTHTHTHSHKGFEIGIRRSKARTAIIKTSQTAVSQELRLGWNFYNWVWADFVFSSFIFVLRFCIFR